MRSASLVLLLLPAALPLAACGGGGSKAKQAEADAHAAAAGFVPPSVLSRLDFGGTIERRFHALDRNGDNVLTDEELPRQDSRLMALDRNKDGRISSTEWSEGMLDRFDRMDLNHDGSVTSDERARFEASERK
ncbi:EF hand [Sphingomonas gellani]|uniref:EF hand n=1 Tax=Sphingomonas gellani TaxID=1166340 RepID=A0A1H8CAI6_9SPHN|nr:hypothetical protein [Sphingomonas gellani]SEM91268.1 EF hand [Sphingomonas gellani]